MKIDYDPAKHRRNLIERGIGFDFAGRIFEGSTVGWPDERVDYGEDRFVAIGVVDEAMLVVVYTIRGEFRRIISARAANKKERRLWQLWSRRA
jgi:uncharacterized DUF497 family protein